MRKVDEVALQNEQVRFSPPGDPGRTPNIEVGQAGVPFVGVVSRADQDSCMLAYSKPIGTILVIFEGIIRTSIICRRALRPRKYFLGERGDK